MSSVPASELSRPTMAGYRELLLSMAKSGSGTIVSSLLSVAATKVLAIAGGPASLAQLATLQQIRQVAVTAATANGQTALVQGITALQGSAQRSYVRTVTVIFAAAVGFVCIAMTTAPTLVVNGLGLRLVDLNAVRWLTIPVILTSVFVFLCSLLNALGTIGGLAVAQVAAGAVFLSGLIVAMSRFGATHVESIVWAMAISAATSVVIVCSLLTRHSPVLATWVFGCGPWWTRWAIRRFLSVSTVMFVTGSLSSISLLAVRAHVAADQGPRIIGQFDAAWTISMTHVALALASLQTYFLPTLARCGTLEGRNRQIENALAVIPCVAVAVIVVMALSKSFLIEALYSAQFHGASRYLRWTLLGDYWKVASWVLSTPLVAAGQMNVFLCLDLLAYGTFVVGAYALTAWWGAAESAAIAFLLMYIVHFLSCLVFGTSSGIFRLRRSTVLRLGMGFAVVLTSSLISWGAE